MKKLGAILILAAFIAAGFIQKNPVEKTVLGMGTDYFTNPEILNGKVKLLRETNYWGIEKDGKIVKGKQMTWKDLDSVNSTKNFVAYFDEKGSLKQLDHFDVNNVIHDSGTGRNENGKYTSWNYKLSGKDYSHSHMSYDDMGFVTGSEQHSPKDSLMRKQVATPGKGYYTKMEYFDPKGKKLFYQVLTLNNEGKVIDLLGYNGKDSLVYRSQNTYDEKGLMKKQNTGNAVWDYKYLKFDQNGNWLELVATIDNGKYRIFAERYYEYY